MRNTKSEGDERVAPYPISLFDELYKCTYNYLVIKYIYSLE